MALEAVNQHRQIKQDEELINTLEGQLSQLKDIREPWEADMKECMEFALPRRSVWQEDEEEGRTPPRRLYNTEAGVALKLQSVGFQGYMCPRTTPWFRLKYSSDKARTLYRAGLWLENVEKAIYAELARSNFYDSLAEFTPDAGCSGTSSMYIGEDQKSMARFSTRHPMEFFIAQNDWGQVDTEFRVFRMTAKAMIQRFGEAVHERVREAAGRTPYKTYTVVHAVFPRDVPSGKLAPAQAKPFASYYYDQDNRHFLSISGYDEFPFLTWRWAKNSFETYGRSPTMDALSEIKMINQMARTRINLAQYIADPPMNIPESMKGEEQIVPHGYNYITDRNLKVEPIALGQNYPVTIDVEQRVSQTIRDHYNVDFYLMLSQANQAGREMTAREVIELQGEKSAILGTTIGTFESEVLEPMIKRVYGIMLRRGDIPEPPEDLARMGGRVEIDYVGPMAQAQKKYHQTAGITLAMQAAFPIVQMDPGTLIRINTDELMKQVLEGYGMPQGIIREDLDVEKIKQAQAQAQQQQMQMQMQMEQQKTIAPNVDKLNQSVQPGSMLEAMAAAQGGQK